MRYKRFLPLMAAAMVAAIFVVPGCDKLVTETNNITQIDTTLGIECSRCHTDGRNRYLRPEAQWANSQHASDYLFIHSVDVNGETEDVSQCGPQCHTHEGYLAWLENGSTGNQAAPSAIGCFTCHAPHTGTFGAWSDTILRAQTFAETQSGITFVTLADGIYEEGRSNICAQCHQAVNAHPLVNDDTVTIRADFGPHSSCQADALTGSGAHYFGSSQPANSHSGLQNGCLDCHYGSGSGFEFGEHTFRLSNDMGQQHLDNCVATGCHASNALDSLHDFETYDSIWVFADSLETLLKSWRLLDPTDPDGLKLNVGKRVEGDEAAALYNYLFYRMDGSRGVHNPAFFDGILRTSVAQWDDIGPAAFFGMSDSVICLGESVQFFDSTVSVVDVEEWTWNFGSGDLSNEQNPVFEFPEASTYNVVLEVVDNFGVSTFSRTVIVTGPVADFEFDTLDYFAGDTVWFYDLSECVADTSTTWEWDFGDTSFTLKVDSVTDSVAHVFWTAGNQTVSLTVDNDKTTTGSTANASLTTKGPQAAFTADRLWGRPDTTGLLINFTNESEFSVPLTYLWDFGDPNTEDDTSSLVNPSYQYERPGDYTVTLRAFYVHEGDTLDNTAAKQDYIRVFPPAALFTVSDADDCAPHEVTFYNKSLGELLIDSIGWYFGDYDSTIEVYSKGEQGYDSVTFVYDSTQLVSCSLAVFYDIDDTTVATKWARKYDFIDVLGPRNEIGFTLADTTDPTICALENVSFTGTAECGVTSWLWDFGDSVGTSTEQNPTYFWDTPGKYDVTLTTTSPYGSWTSPQEIIVSDLTVTAKALTSGGCAPRLMTFAADHKCPADSFKWVFDDGTDTVRTLSDTVEHTFNEVGLYTVSVIAYGSGDPAIDEIDNKVNITGPTADFVLINPSDTFVCAGTDVGFNNIGFCEITDWAWDFGDPNTEDDTSSLENPTWAYSTSGTYSVSLIVSNGDIADTAADYLSIEVTNLQPTVAFGDVTDFGSFNYSFQFTAVNWDAAYFDWDHDGATNVVSPPTNAIGHQFPGPGTYDVELFVENICGESEVRTYTLTIPDAAPVTIGEKTDE